MLPPPERDNTVAFVCGRKGSGKSTLARRIAAEWPRVVALDSMGEYGERDRYRIAEGRQAIAESLIQAEDARAFRLSLRSDDVDDLRGALSLIYEMRDVLLVIEETSLYCSPAYLPPEVSRLVRYGRHRAISQLYVARRPAEIHRDLTANCDVVVTFVQHEERDLAYLRAIAGAPPETIRTLPPYVCMAFGDRRKFPAAVIESALDPPQTRLDL